MADSPTTALAPHESPAPRRPTAAEDARGLVVEGVSKRWRSPKTVVLDGIDLVLPSGTRTSVKGSNGAGKTTLLRTIGGLIKPDAGRIRLDGIDSESGASKYRSRIGLLAAGNTGLVARLSVYHNMDYCARLALIPRDRRLPAIERLLDGFGLRDLAPRRVDRLSMGQRQRVRAALAVMHEPSLLLLDEPQTSLDDEGLNMLNASIDGLVARGAAVLWCSPTGIQDEGADFDQRLVLHSGRLEQL